ncbi:MAG: bifunctional hydroxymethylpyrimidine kinase/phosphomethylpyrimidine kinase, partial [Pseudomonadota bacterium]
MARILAISSQVAVGHVGLSAAVPVLQVLGHDVIALPTIVLSNHPGHAHVAGAKVPVEQLRGMLEAVRANGRLAGVNAVLTGYLPTPAHVRFAREAIDIVTAARETSDADTSEVMVVVDPVIGDAPGGLYVQPDVAEAIRDVLLAGSLAARARRIATPNRFELGWLSSRPVDTQDACIAAARTINAEVIVTSAPTHSDTDAGDTRISNLRVRSSSCGAIDGVAQELPGAADVSHADVERLTDIPHGTGDLFAALYLGALLRGGAPLDATTDPLGFATAAAARVVAASRGADDLRLAATLH